MVERIRQILATRGLSPTQFADTIGIGRPVVSHILSGRNKPSLEVMQKIADAFPELALPWLLKGEGPMLASATPTAVAADTAETNSTPVAGSSKKKQRMATPTSSEPTREAEKPKKEPVSPPVDQPQPDKAEESAAAQPLPPTAFATPAPLVAPPAPIATAPPAAAVLPAALAAAPVDKAIRRIIIFYQDGTFTDYQPEK